MEIEDTFIPNSVMVFPSNAGLLGESMVTILRYDPSKKNLKQVNAELNGLKQAISINTTEQSRNILVDKLLELKGPQLLFKFGDKLEKIKVKRLNADGGVDGMQANGGVDGMQANARIMACKRDLYQLLSLVINNCKEFVDGFNFHVELVRAGVARQIASDITECSEYYEGSEVLSTLVDQGVLLLCVLSRSKEAASMFDELITKSLYLYVDPQKNSSFLVVCTMCAIERCCVDGKHELHTLLFKQTFIQCLVDLVKSSQYDDNRKCHLGYGVSKTTGGEQKFRMAGIINCLQILGRSEDYLCLIHQHLKHADCQTKMETYLHNGTHEEQKRTQDLLRQLVQHRCSTCVSDVFLKMLVEHLVGPGISPSASFTLKMKEDPPAAASGTCASGTVEASGRPNEPRCQYKEECLRFLEQELKIHKCLRDFAYDRCFCTACMQHRGDAQVYRRGKPPAAYALPEGWFKLALKVPPRSKALNIFEEWHMCYHGTKTNNISSILEIGELCMPGDIIHGKELEPPVNHFQNEPGKKPKDWVVEQFFFTPSIVYAGMQVYAKKHSFEDGGRRKIARVAFQVRIKSGTYQVGKQTIIKPDDPRANTRLDPLFSNESLEWSTNHRGVAILTGLLINVTDDCEGVHASGHVGDDASGKGKCDKKSATMTQKFKGLFKKKSESS